MSNTINEILEEVENTYPYTERLKAFSDIEQDILFNINITDKDTKQDITKLISLSNASERDIKDLEDKITSIETMLLNIKGGKQNG